MRHSGIRHESVTGYPTDSSLSELGRHDALELLHQSRYSTSKEPYKTSICITDMRDVALLDVTYLDSLHSVRVRKA